MGTFTGNTVNDILIQKEEYGVQHRYHSFFEKELKLKFTTPLKSDGYGVNRKSGIYMFNEFKKDVDLSKRDQLVRVLVQTTYGLRKMILDHKNVNVVFIGDKDEFIIISPKSLEKYFHLDIDWGFSPSQAYTLKNELYDLLYHDNDISPIVHKLTYNNLKSSIDYIKQIATDGFIKIKITPDNFLTALNQFRKIVLDSFNLNANEWANLFCQLLTNPNNNDISGVKTLPIISSQMLGRVPIKSRDAWDNFWLMYERNYTLIEKEDLVSNLDRIIEEGVRRKQGEFFTPKIFVKESHKYISDVFGDDWKNKYFVWDCCWGTGNLTKDEKFSKLFVTTLHNEDIETAKSLHYNDEALCREVFDFLNHPDEFLPQPIKEAIKNGKEIIFLINPPYATSNVAGNSGEDKAGTSQTEINKIMKEEGGWGKSVQQLYTQFMYRIMKIPTKTHICMFSKPTFLTGDAFDEFRKKFLTEYEFKKGFVMDAKEFADVKTSWPLTFSIFENIK